MLLKTWLLNLWRTHFFAGVQNPVGLELRTAGLEVEWVTR